MLTCKVKALTEGRDLDASNLDNLYKVCSSEEVRAIWKELKITFPKEQIWEKMGKEFAKSLILMGDLPLDLIIKEVGRV